MSTTEPQQSMQGESKPSIEESREKRLARIKSKQRDRGGIFKPAETNPLIDILMAKDVSGRSPSKARRKSGGHALKKGREGSVDSVLETRKADKRKQSTAPAADGVARRKSGKGSRAGSQDVEEAQTGRHANEKSKNDKCEHASFFIVTTRAHLHQQAASRSRSITKKEGSDKNVAKKPSSAHTPLVHFSYSLLTPANSFESHAGSALYERFCHKH